MSELEQTRSTLAKLGFVDLSGSLELLQSLNEDEQRTVTAAFPAFELASEPDQALRSLVALIREAPREVRELTTRGEALARFTLVLGGSLGLAEFFERNHGEIVEFARAPTAVPSRGECLATMLEAVGASAPNAIAGINGPSARALLRIRYRRLLARIAAFDLAAERPMDIEPRIALALADLADATLESALCCARADLLSDGSARGAITEDELAHTELAVIAMGKTGAQELNYVSDVDVVFVGGSDDTDVVAEGRALEISTRLATGMMRVIDEFDIEPPLWDIDANLRPEGKDGALVRTLNSHVAYYDRWAKGWEFQALLKARFAAGSSALGDRYIEALWPRVWLSATSGTFVADVQRMRERVMEFIPADETEFEMKLGPGGLRDVEFAVQLLQLVHGRTDDRVRQRATLDALQALSDNGYVGRHEAQLFADDYRLLRVFEHRVQLRRLHRTHLFPADELERRALARGSRVGKTAEDADHLYRAARNSVRDIHTQLFYRPLLTAVAVLPEADLTLTPTQAEARLQAIGFKDPQGALAHIAALTRGVSRKAEIAKHLLPVMLPWFAEGYDPDYGLLAFRRLSEQIGDAYWFSRMLRDSPYAAERLSRVLSMSRLVGELFDILPDSAAWVAHDTDLAPRSFEALDREIKSIVDRHGVLADAARAIMAVRRREVLRLALSSILGIFNSAEIGTGLSRVNTAILRGLLWAIAPERTYGISFGVIAMGRYGGMELGFSSDVDVMYVYQNGGAITDDEAAAHAGHVVALITSLVEDLRLPLDLDLDLRPEGKSGPVARSLDSYRAYYQRWSETWESQALLRANPVAGTEQLLNEFAALIDPVRYPSRLPLNQVREIRQIKARVEKERLPAGADPARHLKLGRGSLSDVEWLVQLIQLQHAFEVPELKTTSTIDALRIEQEHGYLSTEEADLLREAWQIASRARSATMLAFGKAADVLPTDRNRLEAIARLLNYPPGSANWFENEYLGKTRRARHIFEQRFYGSPEPYFGRPFARG